MVIRAPSGPKTRETSGSLRHHSSTRVTTVTGDNGPILGQSAEGILQSKDSQGDALVCNVCWLLVGLLLTGFGGCFDSTPLSSAPCRLERPANDHQQHDTLFVPSNTSTFCGAARVGATVARTRTAQQCKHIQAGTDAEHAVADAR